MDDKVTQKIVLSILKFLHNQLETGSLTEDSAESIEVAIQCLESAFIGEKAVEPKCSVPDLFEMFSTSSEIWAEMPEAPLENVSDESKAEAEKLKNVGNNLMKEEKFGDAIKNYSSAISLDPTNAVYFCNRAAAHSKLNNHVAAIQDCKNAIRLDPSYSKAYGRLGIAYSSMNQLEEARANYLKALELEPDNESYRNNLNLTNEQITAAAERPQPAFPNPAASPLDLSVLINNPTLMNMASQMLSNPNMQNIMSGLMSMGQGDSNVEALLQAGQQLAQQMQSVNPDFVDSLRRQMGGTPSDSDNPIEDPSSDSKKPDQ